MKRIPLPNRALALPLTGLVFTWVLSLGGQWVSLLIQRQYQWGLNPTVYIFLAALATSGISSLVAQGWAVKAHAANEGAGLERAAHRFTTLAVILSLSALVIFVFATFMNGFGFNSGNRTVLDNVVMVYLPIILATTLVVVMVLRAFVFERGSQVKGESAPRLSEQQKALALGYAIPILTTAFAIIFGLAIYQATRTNLQIWVWVVIIAIVGAGVVAGTRFAARAKSARQAAVRPKTALAAGAANLNFVLSIIFGGVVTIMAFTFGSEAINKLQVYQGTSQYPTIKNPELNWYLEDLAPAKVLLLLAVVGVYLAITERHRKRENQA